MIPLSHTLVRTLRAVFRRLLKSQRQQSVRWSPFTRIPMACAYACRMLGCWRSFGKAVPLLTRQSRFRSRLWPISRAEASCHVTQHGQR